MRLIFSFIFTFLVIAMSFSQRGKHGVATISSLNFKVNEFTTLSAVTNNSILTVSNSSLNTNSRFTNTLQVGDLLMVMQMQGAVIKTFNAVLGQDSTYGQILNYNGAGNYEFVQVNAIPDGTTIVIDCGLSNTYLASGKVQVVRVPRFSSMIVNAGASLTSDAWNGSIGGILAVEVNGNTIINGTVTATGLGFRGGVAANNGNYGGSRFVDVGGGANEGGEKGESIAGSGVEYAALYNGKYAKGAPANGGGGGDSHNAGGGGGANAGNINSWYGQGTLNPTYAPTYSLEYTNRHTIVSSGGGKGGYSFSNANLNPLTTAPSNAVWGGDGRRNQGGFGGRPLDYSTGRIYLGGGGGAGHVNDLSASNTGGHGGAGGGLIFFECYGNITGTGIAIANGSNGTTATGPNPGPFSSNVNGIDGAGGGGGGGTIIFNTTGSVSAIPITANGGAGGNQTIVKGGFATNTEAEGPGGGGAGGYIAYSLGTPVQSVLGAKGGTTNSTAMANFPTNGASDGADGLKDQNIKLYDVTVSNTTVCVNSVATLSANTNSPFGGFVWYNSLTGPAQTTVGSVFTSSVMSSPGTYTVYVGLCPGNFRVPAVITVVNPPVISATSASICGAQTATLIASGGTTYTWSTGSNSATITVNPASTTVYTVTATNGCTAQTTTTVNVQTMPTVTIIPTSTVICASQVLTLSTIGGVGTYSWSNGSNNTPSISVNSAGTYTVRVTNACGTATSSIDVINGPNLSLGLSSSQNTICPGGTVTLTASGTGTFAWSTGPVNVSTISISTSGIYFVTLSNMCGVTSASIAVSNGPAPTLSVVPASSVFCSGQPAVLIASGSATSYTWSNGSTTPTLTTLTAGNFSVVASGSCGVTSSIIPVSFQNSPDVSVVANRTFVCAGDTVKLTATNLSGGGVFSWSSSANTSSVETAVGGGVYTVSYINGCGVSSTTIGVRQSTLVPSFIFSPNGGTAPVTISFTNTSYNSFTNSWNLGNGNTSVNFDESSVYSSPGNYTVYLTIQNTDGCSAVVSNTFDVIEPIVNTPVLGLIPELMTPNGDGKNDNFEIKNIGSFPNNELQIFNRWGNLVYSMNGYYNNFNGTPNYKSNSEGKLPSGTYFYILKLGDAENKVYKGFLQLAY